MAGLDERVAERARRVGLAGAGQAEARTLAARSRKSPVASSRELLHERARQPRSSKVAKVFPGGSFEARAAARRAARSRAWPRARRPRAAAAAPLLPACSKRGTSSAASVGSLKWRSSSSGARPGGAKTAALIAAPDEQAVVDAEVGRGEREARDGRRLRRGERLDGRVVERRPRASRSPAPSRPWPPSCSPPGAASRTYSTSARSPRAARSAS